MYRHNLSVSKLYAEPHLYGKNFDPFVRTVCPSLNAHIRKSDLAFLVRTLDMSKLAYQGSRSTTARLLGRTKNGLLKFVAPQANWGVNCLAALSRCTKLQSLDFSLISEAMSYCELARTIVKMTDLRVLRFPRSATKYYEQAPSNFRMAWPEKLHDLTLSGVLSEFVDIDVCSSCHSKASAWKTLTLNRFRHGEGKNRTFPIVLGTWRFSMPM
jgi:hypothetical protein